MSQGRILPTFYLSDDGEVHPIRIDEQTAAATINGEANTPAAGPATSRIRYLVRAGNRRKVPRARGVYFSWVDARPTGYVGSGGSLPVFSPTVWGDIVEGAVGTYLGVPINITGKYSELPL